MGRLIVPDYRRPRALLVPHYHSTIGGLLEAIATHAARHVGVILLSQDARRSEDFVAAQDDPERFRIVTAPYGYALVARSLTGRRACGWRHRLGLAKVEHRRSAVGRGAFSAPG